MAKKVLIAGATGLVGYAAMKHFASRPDCDVLALSRRRPDDTFGARWLPLDLTDAAACAALAPQFSGTTHLVYAALHERPGLVAGWREDEQIRTNEAMLTNLFAAVEQPALKHVALLQGTKAYGAHLGPYKTPARETDPRIISPPFYNPQQDYPTALAADRPWTWSVMRPRSSLGFSIGSTMNMITALGAYAAISKELGLPLCFPGAEGEYKRMDQAVDTVQLVKASVWAAT